MWLYFNSNGQLIKALEHGTPARVGTTAFSIFAVFEDIDTVDKLQNYSATIKLRKPDLTGSEYPTLLMNLASSVFVPVQGDGVDTAPFELDDTYYGFLFNFADFNTTQETEVLLDTEGLWEATISLVKDDINVQGVATFNVGGTGTETPTEISYEIITNQLLVELNKRALKSQVIISVNDIADIEITDYPEGQMFYDRTNYILYKLISGIPTQVGMFDVDPVLSKTSFNAVQNQAVTNGLGFRYVDVEGSSTLFDDFYDTYGLGRYVVKMQGDLNLFILKSFDATTREASSIFIPLSTFEIYKTTSASQTVPDNATLSGYKNQLSLLTALRLQRYSANTKLSNLAFYAEGTNTIFEITDGTYQYRMFIGSWNYANGSIEIESLSDGARWYKANASSSETLADIMIEANRNDYALKSYVDDADQNLREVAEGKCKSFVLSDKITRLADDGMYYLDSSNVETFKAASSFAGFYVYNSTTEEWENKLTELGNGTYNGLAIVNSSFDSQNSSISFAASDTTVNKYIIFGAAGTIGGGTYYLLPVYIYDSQNVISNFPTHTGDIFLVIETDVPDRWIDKSNGSMSPTYYKLETSKVDVSGFVTGPDSAGDGNITVFDGSTGKIVKNSGVRLEHTSSTGSHYSTIVWNNYPMAGLMLESQPNTTHNAIYPYGSQYGSGIADLGASSYKWKDLYLAGKLYGSTHNLSVDDIYKTIWNYSSSDNSATELSYITVKNVSLSANRTFTLASAYASTLPEYKALITNSGSSSITLTFTGVSNILCNDDNCTITNATNSTLTIPAGVTIECSIVNGKMVAVNFAA